jgi:cytochrome P450
VPGLIRDPLGTLEHVARTSRGRVTRINLGLFQPFLLVEPDHVQQVLRDRADRYVRDGMMWKPLRRFIGNGLANTGETWREHRGVFSPLMSGRAIDALIDEMAEAVETAVADLDARVRGGRWFDARTEMTTIVHRAFGRTFFGPRLSVADMERLGHAIETAMTALTPRLALPFVSESVPLPGDRAYRDAAGTVDRVLTPVIRAARADGGAGRRDILSMVVQADPVRDRFTDAELRDDVIAMFTAGTESTSVMLTWLWVVLDRNPAVAERLYDEIDRVIGDERPTRAHLAELSYTRMVLQELLRLYPAGWIVPRTCVRPDVVGGVLIRPGDTVVVSPYLTHRLASHWERPTVFDPERFAPDREAKRHRFAYFPFSGGPHMCLGNHFFTVQMQLVLATLLSRYRLARNDSGPVMPEVAVSLRPRERVTVQLRPRRTATAPAAT